MVRFLKFLVLAVVALAFLLFAFANHEFVTVSFDPFGSAGNPAFSLDAPLFAVVIVSAMLGVIAGACATWLSQGRHRKASRRNRAEAEKLRAQVEALRNAQGAAPPVALSRDR
jgi:uncharacterized integral membrane protein